MAKDQYDGQRPRGGDRNRGGYRDDFKPGARPASPRGYAKKPAGRAESSSDAPRGGGRGGYQKDARPAPRTANTRGYAPPPAKQVEDATEAPRYGDAPRYNDAPHFNEMPENLLVGRNPIREAIKAGRTMEKLLVADGELSGSAREIIAKAKENGIVVQKVDKSRLDAIYPKHQGMLAYVSAAEYSTVEEMLALAKERGEDPFIVMLDGVTDPHNLGAIIRSAECAGAHGVVIQERRSVGLTPAAVKASAGAVEYLRVARVTNLSRTVNELKEEGLWAIGGTMDGEDYESVDLTGPIALVVGAEGEGIAPLLKRQLDREITLPVKGKVQSLNASVAAGVLMYAIMRARGK